MTTVEETERKVTKMVIKEVIIDAAIYTALDEFCRNDFGQDSEKKIRVKAENTIEGLSTTLQNLETDKTDKAAFSHLSPGWVKLMKSALDLKTFEIEIDAEGKIGVLQRNEQTIYKTLNEISKEERKRLSDMQKSSIFLDAIFFLHNIAGVEIPIDEDGYKKIIDDTINFLGQKGTLGEDIDKIFGNRATIPDMITGIMCLGCDAFEDGIFWMIARKLYATLAMDKKIMNAVQMAAFIGTLVVTNGFDNIALPLTRLVKVKDFVTKLNNLGTLADM